MNTHLPAGFESVKPDTKPQVTFDLTHNRFYVSRTIGRSYGVKQGDRVSLAYNHASRQLLIDTQGRSFYIDSRGYITSARFTDHLRKVHDTKAIKSVKYSVNTKQTNGRFIVLDEADAV